MKKTSLVALASLLFLSLCSAVCVITRDLFGKESSDAALPIAIAIVVLIASAVVCYTAKGHVAVDVSCFFTNSIVMGLLIRAWYILRGFENGFGVMLLVSLSTVLYMYVFFALARIPFVRKSKKIYVIYCVLFALASLTIYLTVMVKTETTYVSTFGYYMILALAFIFAYSLKTSDNAELIRNLAISTYSIFAVAIIVVVFAVIALLAGDGGDCSCDCGDGECCECCECAEGFDVGGGSKKKKRK